MGFRNGPLSTLSPYALLRVAVGLATRAARPAQRVRVLSQYRHAVQLNLRTSAVISTRRLSAGLALGAAISLTECRRPAACARLVHTPVAAVRCVLFLSSTNVERWRVGKYFWNKLGLEYTLMWTYRHVLRS